MEGTGRVRRSFAMKRSLALGFLALLLAFAPPARAQLGVPLPQVPNLGPVVNETTELGEAVTGEALRDVRRAQIRDLLVHNRGMLEADPSGQPIVRSQILALALNPAAIERARATGFQVVGSDDFGGAGAMLTLRAPRGVSTRRALRQLRQGDPEGIYDFDHLHLQSGVAAVIPAMTQASAAHLGPRIGLIDSGAGPPATIFVQRAFAGDTPVIAAHGTAVASLLATAAPGARIYVADIYGRAPTGGAASALARALSWLANENIAVINVSLVGPHNRIIAALVARLVTRGHLIVAAVGNDGPAARPLFPSAYPGVVGITGVDGRGRVLIEAGRGAQVDFAALGVRDRLRGTSFAAPIVAGRLAAGMDAPGAASAERAVASLQAQALDLGARGRDDTYGFGLVHAPGDASAAR